MDLSKIKSDDKDIHQSIMSVMHPSAVAQLLSGVVAAPSTDPAAYVVSPSSLPTAQDQCLLSDIQSGIDGLKKKLDGIKEIINTTCWTMLGFTGPKDYHWTAEKWSRFGYSRRDDVYNMLMLMNVEFEPHNLDIDHMYDIVTGDMNFPAELLALGPREARRKLWTELKKKARS
jgi:hypothetical protein